MLFLRFCNRARLHALYLFFVPRSRVLACYVHSFLPRKCKSKNQTCSNFFSFFFLQVECYSRSIFMCVRCTHMLYIRYLQQCARAALAVMFVSTRGSYLDALLAPNATAARRRTDLNLTTHTPSKKKKKKTTHFIEPVYVARKYLSY